MLRRDLNVTVFVMSAVVSVVKAVLVGPTGVVFVVTAADVDATAVVRVGVTAAEAVLVAAAVVVDATLVIRGGVVAAAGVVEVDVGAAVV